MLTERKWDSIPPRAFALNGGADGSIFLASTKNFKVKQKVAISATGLPTLSLEVKRVLSPTKLIVGISSSKMSDKQDLSLYTLLTNPTIRAEEQDRSGIPTEQHERAVYAEEPIIAKRVIQVDQFGNYYNDENPTPVKIITTPSTPIDISVDGIYSINNSNPDNVGLIAHTRDISPTDTNQTQRLTSITNGVVRSLDVSLHNNLGTPFTPFNPLDVRISGINPNTISKNIYGEKLSIPIGVETTVVSYLMPMDKFGYLLRAEFSGSQFSHYYIYIDGIKQSSKRSNFDLSGEFTFTGGTVDGVLIEGGDLIELTTIHSVLGSYPFEGRLQIAEGFVSIEDINTILQENGDLLLQENDDLIYF